MSALAEALVAAQAELPCALGKDATGQMQDARSEARYTADPSAEPEQQPFDPGEVFACIVDESAGFRG